MIKAFKRKKLGLKSPADTNLRLKLAFWCSLGSKKPNYVFILSSKVGRRKLNFVTRNKKKFKNFRIFLAESNFFRIFCRGYLGVSKYGKIPNFSKLI